MSSITSPQFNLIDSVQLRINPNEHGVVVGRAEYVNANPSYLVRYQRADGIATEAWWQEDALAPYTFSGEQP